MLINAISAAYKLKQIESKASETGAQQNEILLWISKFFAFFAEKKVWN